MTDMSPKTITMEMLLVIANVNWRPLDEVDSMAFAGASEDALISDDEDEVDGWIGFTFILDDSSLFAIDPDGGERRWIFSTEALDFRPQED